MNLCCFIRCYFKNYNCHQVQRPAVTHNSVCKQNRGCTFLGETVATILYMKHHCFCNMEISDNIQFKGLCSWNIQDISLHLKMPENPSHAHLTAHNSGKLDSCQWHENGILQLSRGNDDSVRWAKILTHTGLKEVPQFASSCSSHWGAPVNFLSKTDRPSTEALQALENQSPSITSKENCISFRIFVR